MAVNPFDLQFLGDLNNLLTLAGLIQGGGAKEATSELILSAINGSLALQRITLQAILANQQLSAALAARLADTQSNLLGAIGTPQQSNRPVELPSVPPSGYGGASASQVWAAVEPNTTYTYGNLLRYAGNLAFDQIASTIMVTSAANPWFATATELAFGGLGYNPVLPYFDPHELLAADTITSCLNRINPGVSFFNLDGSDDGYAFAYVVNGSGTTYCTTTFTGLDVARYKILLGLTPAPPPIAAPVWPGLANVTLGTAIAFSGSGFDVPGPMDGVLVELTTVPTPLPYYIYGSQTQYGKLGGVAFATDNGDVENQELLGFMHAVYTPRTMSKAQVCHVRSLSGIVGTVTPWTVV